MEQVSADKNFLPDYPLGTAADPLTWEFLPQGANFNPFHHIPLSAGGGGGGLGWAGLVKKN